MARTKEERRKVGLYPSRDIEVDDALRLLSRTWYRFARSTEKLPPAQIRKVLAALEASTTHDVAGVFLRFAAETGDDGRLATTWASAVNALKVFESQYAWGSKPKREKLAAIAKAPVLLAATQAAVVKAALVPNEMLAVLVLDASPESLDALMPHFEKALTDRERLTSMVPLEKYARATPELKALFARVHQVLEERARTSEVKRLTQRLGIADGKRFRVRLGISAKQKPNGLGGYFDLSLETGFQCYVSQDTRVTTFTEDTLLQDDLGLGRCTLEEVPTWLDQAAKKLGVAWDFVEVSASYLRGQRLDAVVAWLKQA